MMTLRPVAMADRLGQVRGKWVALHNGEVIEACDSVDQVLTALGERAVVAATVIRAPGRGECEHVGLG